MDPRWLRAPRFRTDRGKHRQATWLKLFFDLVFAVARLAGFLRDDLSPSGFAWFAFLFLPMWWLWTDYSYYADLFDSDGAVYRLALLSAMFGIVGVSRIAPRLIEGQEAWGTRWNRGQARRWAAAPPWPSWASPRSTAPPPAGFQRVPLWRDSSWPRP